MRSFLNELKPQPLWNYFGQLNAVPRPSKQEARVIEFIENFGRSLNLEVTRDETGNVLIRKPATAGREARPAVVIQSHLDMVHQKNAGTDFDFATQGIEMELEGDWVRAVGTTLGADNGIGVAAIMAVLASRDLVHPALEALFTVDEETGMTGAKGLGPGLLRGQVLLNLDTEDDRELTIGCAGGVDLQATCRFPQVDLPADHGCLEVAIQGLTGGHSGMEIHLGRGNANKLMNRFLYAATLKFPLRLVSIDGGGLRNAIPRESRAVVALPTKQVAAFQSYLAEESERYQKEYTQTDPDCRLSCREVETPAGQKVLDRDFQSRLLCTVYAIHNGIYRMSPEVKGLVQTSNNLARVQLQEGQLTLQCLTRGSVDSEKMDLATSIQCALELLGAEVELTGAYPGWSPRPDSGIVTLMRNLYQEMFQEEPRVTACHAGLECGILGRNYPDMEMISFGPTILGAHSPDERVQVSSVAKFWSFFCETLARL